MPRYLRRETGCQRDGASISSCVNGARAISSFHDSNNTGRDVDVEVGVVDMDVVEDVVDLGYSCSGNVIGQ